MIEDFSKPLATATLFRLSFCSRLIRLAVSTKQQSPKLSWSRIKKPATSIRGPCSTQTLARKP